jgi:hypothetical protein
MPETLPQQRLLLELLIMSGDIAASTSDKDTILWRTLVECEAAGWLTLEQAIAGYETASITAAGRAVLEAGG